MDLGLDESSEPIQGGGHAAMGQGSIDRLERPALLVLVLFLWDALHGSSPARRRDPRRIAETILLVVLGLVIVGWSIGLRA